MDIAKTEWFAMRADFDRALRRARIIYLGGLLAAAMMRLGALVLTVLLGVTLLDALFAFGERVRFLMGLTLLLGAVAALGYWLITILRLPSRGVASWVDSVLGTRRRPVLSALELTSSSPVSGATEFRQFLINSALKQASQAMGALRAVALLPQQLLRRHARQLGVACVVWLLLLVVWSVPTRTHITRVLAPFEDTPPWSRISFNVSPDQPEVVYGDSIELGATVSGSTGGKAVLFELRVDDRTYRSAGFREEAGSYVHRLERVVQPLQFCVRVGRARSHWHDLTVRYQPRIASAHITLRPPAYTGMPKREFYLGGQELAGLHGSSVTLEISASRPIRRGFLTFSHADGTEHRVDGETRGDGTIRYTWELKRDAKARIHIEDGLGTPNARTHGFAQRAIPDAPPEVALLSPPRYSLATPESMIRVEASVTDGIGLRSAALVRNLMGYRDRPRPVGIGAAARNARVAYPLDLRTVGVSPGQTLELYIEATDTNPSMLGSTMSDISKIEVISRDEYAEILRMRTMVDEFGERYRLIEKQLKALREALRELAATRDESGESGREARRAAIDRALKAWDQMDKSYSQFASDFAIYDAENKLPQVLEAIRSLSAPYAGRLKNLPDPIPESPQIAQQWLDAIGDPAAALTEQVQDAALLDLLVRVARSAMNLQLLIDRQASLVRMISRHEANLHLMPAAALQDAQRQQRRNADRLENWAKEAAALADELPPDQAELAAKMREVLAAIEQSRAADYMSSAVTAAENSNGPDTYRFATAALEALRGACSQCDKAGNTFSGMCRNPGKGLCAKPGQQDTLDQLCQSLARQFGSKHGKSGGMGMGGGGSVGGNPANGYWTSGSSTLDVPLHGPPRSRLSSPTGRGRGHGARADGRPAATVQSSETMTTRSGPATGTHAVTLDEIPERYREPARIFYGIDEDTKGTPQHD
jgi:hypothetical protein